MEPAKVVKVTKSIQLKSYLKVYLRVYICIAVSIHTNAQIPVAGRGMSRHGVVQTSMNYDCEVANWVGSRCVSTRILFDDVEIPILYGLSAIGTRVCVYQWNKATRRITPNAIPIDPDVTSDTAPAAHWDLELMTAEGEERLREIVRHIKEMSAQLWRLYATKEMLVQLWRLLYPILSWRPLLTVWGIHVCEHGRSH